MRHTIYGYEIKDGKVIIVEDEAEKIKDMFRAYLSGLSLDDVAKETGIDKPHSSIGNMLRNRRYLGNNFYPAIIDEYTFLQAETERLRRAEKLGRHKKMNEKSEKIDSVTFRMPNINNHYEDPFRQAEYVYSLIECEVIAGAE